ncbi:hypothetical protein V492_05450, partial [Pseudogymnoascus sp. VKM F-4246]
PFRYVLEIVAVAAGPGGGEECGKDAGDGCFEGGEAGANNADAGFDVCPKKGFIRGESDVISDCLGGDVEEYYAHDGGYADAGDSG